MIQKVLFSIIIGFPFFLTCNNYAQEKRVKETINYLNEKLEGQCKFTYKSYLIIEFFDNGFVHHKDNIDLRDLDTNTMVVNYEEKSIKINCKEEYKNCITRYLYKDESKRHYPRVIFYLDLDEKSFRGFEKAFLHLIRLAQLFGYSSDEPFE